MGKRGGSVGVVVTRPEKTKAVLPRGLSKKKEKLGVSAVENAKTLKRKIKIDSSRDDDSSESDSDSALSSIDENEQESIVSKKKQVVRDAGLKCPESMDDSDSSDGSDNSKGGSKISGENGNKMEVDESDEDSDDENDEEDSDDESDEDETEKGIAVKKGQAAAKGKSIGRDLKIAKSSGKKVKLMSPEKTDESDEEENKTKSVEKRKKEFKKKVDESDEDSDESDGGSDDSGDSGDSDDSDDSDDEEAKNKNGKRKGVEKKVDTNKILKKSKKDDSSAVGTSISKPDDAQKFTVMVRNLSWSAGEDDVAECFKPCGEIEKISIAFDKKTNRSKGVCYVDFSSAEAVEKALELSGSEIDGREIKVSLPVARDQDDSDRDAQGDRNQSSVLFVGNLSWNLSEGDIKNIFSECGDVVNVRLPINRDTGKPKGFGYVEFSNSEDAKRAFQELNGTEQDSRVIRVDYATPKGSAPSGGGNFNRGPSNFGARKQFNKFGGNGGGFNRNNKFNSKPRNGGPNRG